MSKISSTIELKDMMSATINRINQNLDNMMATMSNTSQMMDSSFDASVVDEFNTQIIDTRSNIDILKTYLDNLSSGAPFEKLTQSSLVFGNVVGNIITNIGRQAFNMISNTVKGSVNAYNTQLNAERQLASVLKNTSSNAEASFNAIIAKAEEIQKKGIYGDEAMIAAGAEFATYFSDSDAIESMMDTLSDYAMGMSGGGAIDSKSMVDYATNIAKLTTGAYDAMTKKGFKVTESQKAILNGTATESQLIEELGADYKNLSDDMQKATLINNIIKESWQDLYSQMSDTPEGRMIQLQNAMGDLQEQLGGHIATGLDQITQVILQNMDIIKVIMDSVGKGLQVVLNVASKVVEVIAYIGQFMKATWDLTGPILAVVTAGLLAYTIATKAAAVATALQALQQKILNSAMLTSPITWIVAGITALVLIVYKLCDGFAKTSEMAITGLGVIVGALNVALKAVQNVFASIGAIFENLVIGIHNKIQDLKAGFWGLLATVVEVVSGIAEKLNVLPFIEIDTTGLNAAADNFRAKQEEAINSKMEYKDISAPWQGNWAEDAFKQGASVGDIIANRIGDKLSELTSITTKLGEYGLDTSENTRDTVDALSSDDGEELAYLRDLAEHEAINRFTTAEIKVDMGGISQNVNNTQDADDMIDYLVHELRSKMTVLAEGVHS